MSERPQAKDELAGGNGGLTSVYSLFPDLFSRQSTLPRVVAAEKSLLQSVVDVKGTLEADQKIGILHAVCADWLDCRLPQSPELSTAPSGLAPALLKFAMKLSRFGPFLSNHDVDDLTQVGLDDSSVIEAVASVALGHFLCTLASGLNTEIASALTTLGPEAEKTEPPPGYSPSTTAYIQMPVPQRDSLRSSFSSLGEQFGFVPNLYRIQGACPGIAKAEVEILDAVLFPEDHLSRTQKEQIIIRLASLNLNTYMVTLHTQILSLLGCTAEESDMIIDDILSAPVTQADKILLAELSKLSLCAPRPRARLDIGLLRSNGLTEAQIVEGIAMTGFTNFLCTIQFGLGPLPDFAPHRIFNPKLLYLADDKFRPKFSEFSIEDPDSELVARVRNGETDAFADLVRRHTRRVFGTLLGILGNVDDARDSTQEVFLKAFQNIGNFMGRSKFSTWLTSIAVNTGTELLRQRRPTESLDNSDDESGFRPRQIRSWIENPEQQIEKAQVNELVRRGVLRLPEKYRVAILLRDINQLSTEDAAAALSLSIPALKARVLRGRLMLRESLTPYFSRPKGESDV
jgi:RNA polymerase sigma-70 factor, ECF subfamily